MTMRTASLAPSVASGLKRALLTRSARKQRMEQAVSSSLPIPVAFGPVDAGI